jgi:chemotaxis protein histidine kinase CheA
VRFQFFCYEPKGLMNESMSTNSSEPAFDLSEIVELYKQDARRMIADMYSAMSRWDELGRGGPARAELRRLSHQLRGSGRTYGFRNVTRYSKAIEHIVVKLERNRLQADEAVRASIQNKIDRLAAAFGV